MKPGPGNYVHMYISTRLGKIFTIEHIVSGVREDTRQTAHSGHCPPLVYLLGSDIYNFNRGGTVGQTSFTGLLLPVHSEPPLRLAHTLGGSNLNSPWPTGTHVLKVKI